MNRRDDAATVPDCCDCANWDPRDRELDDEGPCPPLNLVTKRRGGGCTTCFIPRVKPAKESEP